MKDNAAKVLSPYASYEVDPRDDIYGPWMVVSRRKPSTKKDKKHDSASTTARHAVWNEGVDV